MKKNKLFTLRKIVAIAAIATVTGMFFTFTGCKTKYTLEKVDFNEPGLSASYVFPEYKEYPEFTRYIDKQMSADYESYKKSAERSWKFSQKTTLTYRTEFEDRSNSRFVNAYFRKYLYSGPDKASEYIITFCYDKKFKKIANVTELSGMTLKEISDYCRKDIKANLKYNDAKSKDFVDYFIDEGTVPELKRFQNITADKKKLTIHFSANATAPEVYGVITVKIPLAPLAH